MLAAGEKLAVISTSLGHSNLSTTADTYAHITTQLGEQSARRIDAVLAG